MKLLSKILALFGFTGKSLDKAIIKLTELDAYLEQVETIENDNAVRAAEAASKAEADKVAAEEKAARAKRIRGRAQEFVA